MIPVSTEVVLGRWHRPRSFLLPMWRIPMWRRRTIYIAIQRRMGTSATRISAPISITNPTSIPASAFPRSSGFYLFGFLAWSSAFKARRTHDIGCFLRQNQSGDGRVANIGGFLAEPCAPGVEPLRRCRRIDEAR